MNSARPYHCFPSILRSANLFSVAILLALCISLLSGNAVAANTDDDGPRHQLNRISDTLYQFTDDRAAGVVLLSDAGAVVVDPMNSGTAQWLRGELEKRFQQRVSYVVYSSAQRHRIEGAHVFTADGAKVIAHENAMLNPVTLETLLPADIVFSDSLSLQLDSTTVDLHYFGKSLTDSNIAVHFPAEQAMYAGDIVSVEAFPNISETSLAAAFIPDWFNTINRMNRIDFVYLLTAQRKIGIQHDGVRHGHFLRELHHRVGQSLLGDRSGDESADSQEISISLNNYRRWQNQDHLPILISGMRQLILQD